MTERADVIVVGAGVIGLSIAWRCRQRGLSVIVVDPDPHMGAWRTAAGMLAPVSELHYGEQELLKLAVISAARYPGFAAELQDETGIDVGYRPSGTVVVAWDAADLAGLRDLHRFQISLGLPAQLLTSRELRGLEPALTSGLPGALLAEGDHSIDNRLLHKALLSGASVLARRAVRVGRRSVDLDDGTRLDAGSVVLAAGAWSAALHPVAVVRPVKGQTLRLRIRPELLSRVVRANVKGSPVYVVPRADGTVVVGASSEEAGFDERPRAGAVYELLRDAQTIIPALGEAELLEVSTGLRPGSPDNAPLIGATADGVIIATGHYRSGILLAPITADGVAELICTGALPDGFDAFAPGRFRLPVNA